MSEFEVDCMKTYGRVLTGKYKHYCAEWDYVPIDETFPEFKVCHCFKFNSNVKSGADINAGDGGYSEGTKEKYDEFVKMREANRGNMVDKTERKNENRKIYIVESVSMFRLRYAVFATCEEDAMDEFTMRTDDADFHEMSQQHIGENIISVRKVSEKKFLKQYDNDNGPSTWSDDQKLSVINVIDYEEDK